MGIATPGGSRSGSARSRAPRRSCPVTSPASRTRARSPRPASRRAPRRLSHGRLGRRRVVTRPRRLRRVPRSDEGTRRSASSSRRSAGPRPSRRRSRSRPRRASRSCASRLGARRRRRGRHSRIRARWSARRARSRRCCAITAHRGERFPRAPRDARGARAEALAARTPHRGRVGVGRRVRAPRRPRRGGRHPVRALRRRDQGPARSRRSRTTRCPRTRSTAGRSTTTPRLPRSLALLRDTGDYDILLAQVDLSRHRGEHDEAWCALIVERSRTSSRARHRPVVTSVHATDPPPAIARLARERDVALLRGTREGLRAIAAVARWRGRPARGATGAPRAGEPLPPARCPSTIPARSWSATASGSPRRERCESPEEAAAAFERLGGPVVVKVAGPPTRRPAAGSRSASPVRRRRASRRAPGRASARRAPGRGGCRGVLRADARPRLRARACVGLGGRALEALGLAAVALAPLDDGAPRALVAEAPGPGADSRAPAPWQTSSRAPHWSRSRSWPPDHPEVDEIDVNPLILGADGAIAVDALVVVKGAS